MAPARPKLLFLAQTLPFPPDGGVKIRTFHTLKILADAFDVTALCFYRWKPHKGPREGVLDKMLRTRLDALGRFAQVEAFRIPQEHSHWRFLWDHCRSLVSLRAYTVFAYDSHEFRSRLRKALATQAFDLVHADSLDLSGYFPVLHDHRLVCAHHDAQSRLLRRRSVHETSPARRAYLRIQSRLMEKEETLWCPRVSLNVTVSEIDRDALRDIAGAETAFEVVPNGVDIDTFQPSGTPTATRSLVFVGGTSWFPNLDALRYFASDLLPLLRERTPDVHTTWVGRASEEEREEWNLLEGLTLTGYVDDIRPHVHGAACYIVPLRVGGGTRLKILDAWAMGKAVVSTSVGCEGLTAVDGENILIRDDPESFASAVTDVLQNPSLRHALGKAARQTVEERYSWDAIGHKMIPRYLGLLDSA